MNVSSTVLMGFTAGKFVENHCRKQVKSYCMLFVAIFVT